MLKRVYAYSRAAINKSKLCNLLSHLSGEQLIKLDLWRCHKRKPEGSRSAGAALEQVLVPRPRDDVRSNIQRHPAICGYKRATSSF